MSVFSVTNVLLKSLKMITAALRHWTLKANSSFEALKERAMEAKTITRVIVILIQNVICKGVVIKAGCTKHKASLQ
jgi:hypothetical protein